MKYLVIIAFLLCGCGAEESVQTEKVSAPEIDALLFDGSGPSEVDPEWQDSYNFYVDWLQEIDVEPIYKVESIGVDPSYEEQGLGGTCHYDSRVVTMDPMNYYLPFKDFQKKYNLIHEMMHCQFNLDHDESIDFISANAGLVDEYEFSSGLEQLGDFLRSEFGNQ